MAALETKCNKYESWVVYLLECADKTIYCGITNNLPRRITQHNEGRGAKYTKFRRPVKIIHTESYPNRSTASRREIEIKSLSRPDKLELSRLCDTRNHK